MLGGHWSYLFDDNSARTTFATRTSSKPISEGIKSFSKSTDTKLVSAVLESFHVRRSRAMLKVEK